LSERKSAPTWLWAVRIFEVLVNMECDKINQLGFFMGAVTEVILN
jgi:hypothetical protein